ncbi:melanin-concentrating hormone receptor 2 [Biomphalaria glabrata]|nr:melanin-concentrating hormone receptor 2 [Biomphalaria glabrata]
MDITEDIFNAHPTEYINSSELALDANINEENTANTFHTFLFKYFMFILCSIGLPGNTLIVITMVKPQPLGPASFLIVYLAVSDCVALVIILFEYQLQFYEENLFFRKCQLFYVPATAITAVCNWTHVLISFERFVSIYYPIKRRYLLTLKRTKFIVTLLSVFLVVSVILMFQLLVEDNECKPKYIDHGVFLTIQGVLYIFCPFSLVTFFTTLVVKKLHHISIRRLLTCDTYKGSDAWQMAEYLNSRRPMDGRQLRQYESSLSKLVIAASCMFFFLNVSSCVFFLIIMHTVTIHDSTFSTITDFLFVLNDCTHAFNFFIYLFLDEFRKKVCALLKVCFKC